ncbi:winged helix-turn-helix domain-containing protein [Serratia odorifera]|uniref:winged helix-turn-helix domain-containing protein n=1 Tax=Serratia odorifera TaxID=618 RepID=UPI003531A93C
MSKLYGYLIDSSVLYLPLQHQVISNRGEVCHLRKTMGELLDYLMQNADKGIVTDDDIIFSVWERNNLSGSYSRLWQVMRGLKSKLEKVGIQRELFIRARGQGYYLVPARVIPLYTKNKTNIKVQKKNSIDMS